MYTSFDLLVIVLKHVKLIVSPSDNDCVQSGLQYQWDDITGPSSRLSMIRKDLFAENQNPLQFP